MMPTLRKAEERLTQAMSEYARAWEAADETEQLLSIGRMQEMARGHRATRLVCGQEKLPRRRK